MLPGQFEHGEEQPDHRAAGSALEGLPQRDPSAVGPLQAIDEILLVKADRRVVVLDRVLAETTAAITGEPG